MDDELGDFFSEIEKVEQVVTTGSSTSQTTQNNDEVYDEKCVTNCD